MHQNENSNILNAERKRRKTFHRDVEEKLEVEECIQSEGENNERYKYSSAKKWRKKNLQLDKDDQGNHSPPREKIRLLDLDNCDEQSSIFAGKEQDFIHLAKMPSATPSIGGHKSAFNAVNNRNVASKQHVEPK